ncbi:hypothetical protein [Phenylobacterium sp. 58.2.17]|jgi:hypothetical protein|uniref:hypothetical protein n=1 Tax=Phenylobacterium sp. 58.2.17 TaxID=2969306 RepID=UPI0022647C1A|nr:hypothetical protein [Phenylobacterium sp. 58.2.17]MCX7586339.1 hypothetical protein [Phenylobacterium sp. 58.2.17]
MATRRSVILGAGIGAMGLEEAMAAEPAEVFTAERVEADLARYDSFGLKTSGGPGDVASGAWLAGELRALGFATQAQAIEVPYFEPREVSLAFGETMVEGLAQAPVTLTGPGGLSGPLVRLEVWGADAAAEGSIAVARLPFARWSTRQSAAIRRLLIAAAEHKVAALVLITDGPTGDALALNAAPSAQERFPIVTVGVRGGDQLLAAAARRESAHVHVGGQGGLRAAHNIVGRLERGGGRRLVVSTPRSGWFGCMGERGGGVAAWLGLARWASRACALDLTFVATSGHEYENHGGQAFLHSALAPAPDATALWVHLGAALAARDWHEAEGRLAPLPSVDPQRFLVARPELVAPLRAAFAGEPGLEAVYGDEAGAGGELGEILAAGYPRAFGILGAHRFHHSSNDDIRCIAPEHVVSTGKALLAAVSALAT